MEKLILSNGMAPGDIIMMTAAVRDLHLAYPGKFLTDVRTPCPALWANNPNITPIRENERGVKRIACEYPLIHRSNSSPYHFIHGFTRHLSDALNLEIEPTLFKGDIHLSDSEKKWGSQLHEITGGNQPFWLIAAGGKYDFTIKWWDTPRWQEVVDQFNGRILFVQIGEKDHHHPALDGVIDLRGKTCLRQLVRLVHHSQGILSPVTALMHLAAAVETAPAGLSRPCVVVAGGREPSHWEAYPGHRFMHTIGALKCCSAGGCWRSRTLPLKDGDSKDLPENLCLDVVGNLPRCMDIITPEQVVAQIESYFQPGGPWRYLNPGEAERVAAFTGWDNRKLKFHRSRTELDDTRWSNSTNGDAPLSVTNVAKRLEQISTELPVLPETSFKGRGVVICAGGLSYLPSAWVNICLLRLHGCTLPVELWHFPGEIDETMKGLLTSKGVTCVECNERVKSRGGTKVTSGWEMKPQAVLYSDYEEVLFLDADNMAVYDPTSLFNGEEYSLTGAVFWPDYTSLSEDDPIWKICDVPYRDEPEFESGQILIHKIRHWRPLQLALWFNRHAAFFRHYFLGDKETFHFAFRYLEIPYSMPPFAIENLGNKTMCQHDFFGKRLFQHRNFAKWSLHGINLHVPGFAFEEVCLKQISMLRRNWPGRVGTVPRWEQTPSRTKLMMAFAEALQDTIWHLHQEGGESCRVKFGHDGRLHSLPQSKNFLYWDLKRAVNRPHLELSSEKGPSAELERDAQDRWSGLIMNDGENKRIQVSYQRKVPQSDALDPVFQTLVKSTWLYRIEDRLQREMTLNADGTIAIGAGHLEMFWTLDREENARHTLRFWDWEKVTTCLLWNPQGWWEGKWIHTNKQKVSLRRMRSSASNINVESEQSEIEIATIKLASQADCERPNFRNWCSKLNEQQRYHRRQWELITTLEMVELHLKEELIQRVIVVTPTNDSLVDALASLGPEIVCVLQDNWRDLPPSRRANKLLSAKREFNSRGITPWQSFEKRVRLLDAGGEIPVSEIEDPDHTAVIWHNPLQLRSKGSDQLSLDDIAHSLPSVAVVSLTVDVVLEPSENVSESANEKPPSVTSLVDWLKNEGFGSSDIPLDFGHSGPIDTYVDPPPYQKTHHLRFRTSYGTVTSACLFLKNSQRT